MPLPRLAPRTVYQLLAALIALALLSAVLAPPIPQDPAYYRFADDTTRLGIPNFWNVATDLPFVLVGFLGLRFLYGPNESGMTEELRPIHTAFFVGSVLIGLGSGYFHWHPDGDTLLWDRLPMTVSFMAFFCIVIAETLSANLGRRLFWPLLAAGLLSVLYWYGTETLGRGDLRPYALVQFLPMLILPVLLAFPPSGHASRGYWAVLGFYAAAKVAELLDGRLYELLWGFSGHSLKHLLAAAGAYSFLATIERRRSAAG
ncbi:MAG TPA: ceramidase domain-containing protein [Methylococcaceae bacterium]|nr:ceramidase domain-containing protein [Methylococcaceae bacterium]